eukprot:sb/3463669/
MILLLFLGLAAAYPTGDEERALQSPALLRNLFSGYQRDNGSDDEPRPLSLPSSFSWIDRGAVLPPYDQAKCGSCWSFSAAAALEGAYKAASGKLKKLSEQEYLDCSLKSSMDGCSGGFYYQAWDYNKKQGRMGRGNDRPYRARTGKCTDLTENSLKSHTVTGYWAAPNRNEADTLYGITQGVLSVAFEVTETFSAYKSGILRDNTCSRGSNHAVVAVAYTPSYILIRNSWGSSDDEPRPLSLPSSFSWVDRGAVLPPYDQAKCGSCWSFSAAAALEGAYKAASGKLKKLSEQEYLDCSLKSSMDGCSGGFYYQAWDYNKKQGRMGRGNDRPYRARTGKCNDLTENSLKSHTVTGYWAAPNRNEADTLYGITQGVLSVAFEVTETFSAYKSGILRDNTCSRGSNHAVVAVAYTPSYILIRNSWGSRWGDRGFVKFARGHHNCETHRFTAYPKLKATGKGDNDKEDSATVYDPENSEGPTDPYNPGPAPPCEDKGNFCDKGNYCGTSYESYCRKTCGKCGESGNECPEGTVRCSDGKCRHTHMC